MSSVDRPTHARADVEHDALVIAMVGELDMAREGELLTILDALDPLPETLIDVDLGEVTFIDSSGLRGLLRAQAYLSGRRCRLRVRRPGRQFLKVVDLLGVTSMLTFVDSSDADTATEPTENDGEAIPAG